MNYVIRANLDEHSGYGQHAMETGRQLVRLGHTVRFESWDPAARPEPDGNAAQIIQLSPPVAPCSPGAVYLTTWESDALPRICGEHLRPARLVIVNSQFIRRAFERSGVRPPVRVVPLGVCPEEFHPVGEPPQVCRFGLVANLTYEPLRKNVAGAIAGFLRAFPTERDVALTLKVNDAATLNPPADPRIQVIATHYSTTQLCAFYNSLTCLVSASLGEGFGLCPLQALACGRPVIATTFGGHGEYLDATVGYPVTYDLSEPAWHEGGGRMALPAVDSLAARMREVYADRATAAAKGQRGLERAAGFGWDRYGERLAALLGALSPAD